MVDLSIIFLLFMILVCFLMQRLTRCFTVISIPGMTFIFLFLYHGWYIPILLLRDHIDEFAPIYLDNALKYRLFYSLVVMYGFFVSGIAFTKKIFNFETEEIIDYGRRETISNKGIYPTIILVFVVMMVFGVYYVTTTNVLPRLIEYFSSIGDENVIRILRQEANPEERGLAGYLFGWVIWVFLPLLSLILLSLSIPKRKMVFKTLALVSIITTMVLGLSVASKYPTVHFVTTLLFFILIWKGRIRVIDNKVVFIVVILLVYSVSTSLYYIAVGSVGNALYLVWVRLFQGPNYALLLHLKYFPDVINFLGGRDIALLSKIMGWEYVSSPGLLASLAFGKVGNANAAFISGLWVNFGYLGIVLGSFLLGVYLCWVQIWLVRRPKTVTNVVLYSYLCVQVWHLANVSMFPALFAFGIGSAPLFVRIFEIMSDIVSKASG